MNTNDIIELIAAAATSAYKAGYQAGYVDGVSDARMRPAEADARVAELCRYDDFGEDLYQGDSGDENGYVAEREHDLRMANLSY